MRTRDSAKYVSLTSNVNRHASSRAAVQDRERCTHPMPDATGPPRRASRLQPYSSSRHRISLYRIPRSTLGEFAVFSAAFEPSCRWVTRHDHAPWPHHPPTLIYAPHGRGKHHGSHHGNLPICGPLPCSHLLQRSHQECDGVIGLLFSERVDCRIQLRGEAVLGEVLKHPRGAPCWSRGCGSR